MRILLVDDDPLFLELAREFFEDSAHSLEACSTQLEAQGLLAEGRFDSAVVDFRLQGGAGKLLVSTILRSHPGMRLVVVTGDHAPETRSEVAALGARHLLFKPFRFRQLLDALEEGRTTGPSGPRLTVYQSIDEEEIDALKRVLMSDPGDSQARWLLAFSYYRAHKYADSSHLFREILKADGGNRLALYYLGACQYRFGLYEDAVRSWEKVAVLDPDGPLGRKVKEHVAKARELIETGGTRKGA